MDPTDKKTTKELLKGIEKTMEELRGREAHWIEYKGPGSILETTRRKVIEESEENEDVSTMRGGGTALSKRTKKVTKEKLSTRAGICAKEGKQEVPIGEEIKMKDPGISKSSEEDDSGEDASLAAEEEKKVAADPESKGPLSLRVLGEIKGLQTNSAYIYMGVITTLSSHQQEVVVKCAKDREQYEDEMKAIAALDGHKAIAKYYMNFSITRDDIEKLETHNFIVSKKYDVTLKDYIEHFKTNMHKIPYQIIMSIIKKALAGLETMQRHGYVHTDLHTGNIVLENIMKQQGTKKPGASHEKRLKKKRYGMMKSIRKAAGEEGSVDRVLGSSLRGSRLIMSYKSWKKHKPKVKIIDFGLAMPLRSKGFEWKLRVKSIMPLERLLNCTTPVGIEYDVWALGCHLLEMTSNDEPFYHKSKQRKEVVKNILQFWGKAGKNRAARLNKITNNEYSAHAVNVTGTQDCRDGFFEGYDEREKDKLLLLARRLLGYSLVSRRKIGEIRSLITELLSTKIRISLKREKGGEGEAEGRLMKGKDEF